MRSPRQAIRIFISSPGDVVEERELARKVIEQLRRRYAGRLDLKAVLWEDMPLGADTSFTAGIDLVLSDSGIDIAVFILWSRLGSPTGAFFARPDGSEYRSGTEREFALMLAARRQSGGERPHILVYARADESTFEERLRGQPTDAKSQLLDQKRLVEGFIREEFQDPERRTNIRAYHSFDRPQTFSQRLRVHLAELLDGIAGDGGGEPLWNVEEQGPPFLGLAAYQFGHAAIFFGREDEIVGIRQALREQACRGSAFVLVSGASGSGKSSLARAGVLPAIVENEIDETISGWCHAAFTPGEIGGDLFAGLARVLGEALPALGTGHDALAELAEGLATNPALTFKLRIKGALAATGGRHGTLRLILLVDQIEELFTDARIDDAKREQFATALEVFARSGAVWVVATVRSDFAHHCQGVPALVRLCEGAGRWDLLQPTADAIGRVIHEPARLAGLFFEKRDGHSLADRILRDAVEHRELMPLLSHVLRGLCGECTGKGMLTFAAYEKAGGVQGSLANHAEATFQALPPESQQALPALLTELVTLGGDDGCSFARRRPTLASLSHDPAMRLLVERFIAARLLTAAGGDASPDATATLAHEALMRVWDRIRDWAAANREHLRLRARIEPAQERWQLQSRHPSLLLAPGLPLEEGRGLLEEAPALLSPGTREYIEASITRAETEQTRRRRIRRSVTTALSLLLVAALIATGFAWRSQRQTGEALRLSKMAAAREAEASKQADEILTKLQLQRAEELFDADDASGGLAYLAGVLRRHPGDQITAARLLSALRDRSYARPSLKPLQHAGSVMALAWSPNGKRLVTLTKDHIHVWDTATGQPVCAPIVAAPDADLRGVRFSKDGRQFVATGTDSQVFDSDTGQPVSPLLVHKGRGGFREFVDAIFCSDGKSIVTVSQNRKVGVWMIETGEQVAELKIDGSPEAGRVYALAMHPDGVRFALSLGNGSIMLWDSATQRIEHTWKGVGLASALIFSPDGSRLFAMEHDLIVVCDLATNELLPWKIQTHEKITSFDLSPDGHTLAVATFSYSTRFFSADTGEELGRGWQQTNSIDKLQYRANGARLLSVSKQVVRVRDVATGIAICAATRSSSEIECAGLSDDGLRLAVGTAEGEVKIWEVSASESRPVLFGLDVYLPRCVLNPDETRIATPRGTQATIWDFKTGRRLGTVDQGEQFWALTFHPRGDFLVTGGTRNPIVRTWDCLTGKIAKPDFEGWHYHGVLAFSSDGNLLCVSGSDTRGRVGVWNFTTGQRVAEMIGIHPGPATMTPDGKRVILIEGKTYEVKIFDASTAQVAAPEVKYEAPIGAMRLSADGRMFAAGSSDGRVRVWRTADASPVTPWLQHQADIKSVSFSPDGSLLATASQDQTARVWSIPSGKPVGEPIHHAQPVFEAVFCPDGRRLATTSQDGSVRIWDAQTGRAVSDLLPVYGRGRNFLKPIVYYLQWTQDGTRLIGGGAGMVLTWDVPSPASEAPAWLAEWAEAVAGQKLDAQGRIQRVGDDESAKVAAMIAGLPGEDLYTRTAKWFCAPPGERSISPESKISAAEYARLLSETESYRAVAALVRFAPGNARALARYAELLIESPDINASADEIRFLLSRAESLNSKEPWVWRARGLLDQNEPDKEFAKTALASLHHAAELDPDDWRTQRLLAFLLAKGGESAPAIAAASRALANMESSGYDVRKRKDLVSLRLSLLQKIGRYDEAAQDNIELHGIEPRAAEATPREIDLSGAYTDRLDSNPSTDTPDFMLSTLPKGLVALDGVRWDVRGMVVLNSKMQSVNKTHPVQVTGIYVKQSCHRLHFLQACSWTSPDGTKIGRWVVHYADGETRELPVVHGKDLRDWAQNPNAVGMPKNAREAWCGKPRAKELRLYHRVYDNPRPDAEIASIELISEKTDSAPIVVAITLE